MGTHSPSVYTELLVPVDCLHVDFHYRSVCVCFLATSGLCHLSVIEEVLS